MWSARPPPVTVEYVGERLRHLFRSRTPLPFGNGEGSSLRSLTLIRHANTHPAVGGDDLGRTLSPLGITQCEAAWDREVAQSLPDLQLLSDRVTSGEPAKPAESLVPSSTAADNVMEQRSAWLAGLSSTEFWPPRAMVLTSAAGRCRQTASALLDAQAPDGGSWKVIDVKSIYDGSMQPEGCAMFERQGYASLRTYHEEENAEEFLREYALHVLHDLVVEVERDDVMYAYDDSGGTCVVLGHAVYHAAIALLAAEMLELGDWHQSCALDNAMGEASAFLVHDSGVEYLS